MSRIRVVVTAEDIAGPGSGSCPIERALRRLGHRHAIVGRHAYLLNDASNRTNQSKALPRSALRFVDDFDDGKQVQPATFYLEGPDR